MDFTEIGVYSPEEKALEAIVRLRMRLEARFKEWPDGFRIDGHALDLDSWSEGFVSFDDDSFDDL